MIILFFGRSSKVSNTAPTVNNIDIINNSGVYTVTYDYLDNQNDEEDNYKPYATYVDFSGIEEENNTLTGSHNYNNINNVTESGSTFSWYRADDISGTSEILISTATTANYVLTSNDVGKYIRRSVTPVSVLGDVGVEVFSRYSSEITEEIVFNPFTDIAWNEAFDFKTSADLNNYGSGGDLVVGSGTPSYDGANSAVRFVRTSTQFYNSTAVVSHNIPDDIWVKFKTPSSFTGNQTVMAMSNTHRIDYTVTGELRLSGTLTGVILSPNTFYSLRCYLNGASSSYEILGVVSSTSISLSTGGIGIPVVKVGADNTGANAFNGHIRALFIKAGTLGGSEITNMQSWLATY